MKKLKNKIFLNLLGLVLIFLPVISCSNSAKEKVENKKTPVKAEMVKTKMPSDISQTTCTNCHKSDDNGELIFRNENGILELKKKPEKKTKTEVN